MKDRLKQGLFFTLLLFGLLPQIVAFGFMPYISIDRLWEQSEVAVLGNVTSIQTTTTSGHYRVVEIKVEESYIHPLNEPTVKVRIEGGKFGDMEYGAEDQPEFEVDERVFVFLMSLEESRSDYGYRVFGLSQGKFSVDGSRAFREGGETFEIPILLSPEIDGVKPYAGIEFQQLLIVALGVVFLSFFIVWLLTPS